MWTVYVLRSRSTGRFYKGMTQNLEVRLSQHNKGLVTSTKAFVPLQVVYTESFSERAEARKREVYFKSAAGRRFLNQKLEQQ